MAAGREDHSAGPRRAEHDRASDAGCSDRLRVDRMRLHTQDLVVLYRDLIISRTKAGVSIDLQFNPAWHKLFARTPSATTSSSSASASLMRCRTTQRPRRPAEAAPSPAKAVAAAPPPHSLDRHQIHHRPRRRCRPRPRASHDDATACVASLRRLARRGSRADRRRAAAGPRQPMPPQLRVTR